MTLAIQHNPFATRYIRPDQVPFLLREDENLESITETFRANQFVSQIVGPHGCGKTTLTRAIEPLLRNDFQMIRRVTVRSARQVHAGESQGLVSPASRNQLLIIDGFERLPWMHRKLLLRHVRSWNSGLLITTHQPLAGIPVLHEIRPALDTLRLLTKLLAPQQTIDARLLEDVFEQNNGNIRESLMTLYNWFESQQTTANVGR